MSDDKYTEQARAIFDGCPFNVTDGVADALREADAENQRLRAWQKQALAVLAECEQSSDSGMKAEDYRALRDRLKNRA
jgi:hypothetical protein